MPPPSFLLRIPQPCPESWAAMTPTGPGRHCAACAKVVVDFTQLTDVEVMTYFRQAESKTCGRFRANQLERPLQPAAASRWRTWLGALLAVGSLGQLLAPKAAAQMAVRGTAGPLPAALAPAQKPAPTPATGNPAAEPTTASRSAGSRTVRGTVRDAATHDPLPGVTVLLKNTTLGTTTDADGAFTLTIPGDAPTVQLGFHYIGYTSVEQTVAVAGNTPLTLVLNADAVVLAGDVVIIPAKRPLPWYPRRLYHWGKAKLAHTVGQ